MEKKEFKAESKRLLDLMINSIYTNKEIFLRELISNASDAIDKLYYNSLTDKSLSVNKDELEIRIDLDKDLRQITISDNGIGMNKEELETNLGTIAKSGSLAFKEANEKKEDIDIIGQFGVGFYSAFMISKLVTVESKKAGEEKAYRWISSGADGYIVEECEKDSCGTKIVLDLKDNTEDENFDSYLDIYFIKSIVKKYSDYIRYPIKMDIIRKVKKDGTENEYEEKKQTEILNSMIPLWKKSKKDITEEEYTAFYIDNFNDFTKPIKTIHTNVEGQYCYNALIYIPSDEPLGYRTGEFQKGLKLYSNGVMIMENCSDLLPDYFAFVRGLVDSQDLSLNISREMLQHDRQLKVIAKNIENKIKSELENMLENNRSEYEKFFDKFGLQLKFGAYINFGAYKDILKDLFLFYSSTEKKMVTLKEYVSRMQEGQDKIYYASGESYDKIDLLPQVDAVKDKGYEILYLKDNIDEFVFQLMLAYDGKNFVNVAAENVDLTSDEEKENLKKLNEDNKDMFAIMKEVIPDIEVVRFTNRLKNHAVCLTSEGQLSIEMAKTMNAMNDEQIKPQMVLEINENNKIAEKIKKLYVEDKEELKNYTKILYAQARLIEGLSVENPTEISNLICDILSK